MMRVRNIALVKRSAKVKPDLATCVWTDLTVMKMEAKTRYLLALVSISFRLRVVPCLLRKLTHVISIAQKYTCVI